ncbi:putative OXALYL-COA DECARBOXYLASE OXCA domain protein [Mycobacterium xenopi 4042]|uniref:Putative OXALYL-COA DECARBOXYLASE OXCA domain protein n=1 Tax=Mycobacterium xenopi 4042 TaxID=1299334 RepID=X8AJW5_MYCXE|nr:putative OXALYL-COA DECARBOXYLASE OXCA domain protein [Mycobacterium xenopi 4042]
MQRGDYEELDQLAQPGLRQGGVSDRAAQDIGLGVAARSAPRFAAAGGVYSTSRRRARPGRRRGSARETLWRVVDPRRASCQHPRRSIARCGSWHRHSGR